MIKYSICEFQKFYIFLFTYSCHLCKIWSLLNFLYPSSELATSSHTAEEFHGWTAYHVPLQELLEGRYTGFRVYSM